MRDSKLPNASPENFAQLHNLSSDYICQVPANGSKVHYIFKITFARLLYICQSLFTKLILHFQISNLSDKNFIVHNSFTKLISYFQKYICQIFIVKNSNNIWQIRATGCGAGYIPPHPNNLTLFRRASIFNGNFKFQILIRRPHQFQPRKTTKA